MTDGKTQFTDGFSDRLLTYEVRALIHTVELLRPWLIRADDRIGGLVLVNNRHSIVVTYWDGRKLAVPVDGNAFPQQVASDVFDALLLGEKDQDVRDGLMTARHYALKQIANMIVPLEI